MTNKKIAEYVKEGRGQGEGASYAPWLKIDDFSSSGRRHRIPEYKVVDHRNGREHHFFSDLESDYYYYLLQFDRIKDIREQFPLLPVEETERIAEELGYPHPRQPGNDTRFVMTTDFLLTVEDENGIHLEARHLKYEKEFDNPRVIEKMEIEKTYWEERGVLFKIVTEKSFNRRIAKNSEMLVKYFQDLPQLREMPLREELQQELLKIVYDSSNQYQRVGRLMAGLDIRYGMTKGTSLSLFYHLAAHDLIPLRLDRELTGTQPLNEMFDEAKADKIRKGMMDNVNYA